MEANLPDSASTLGSEPSALSSRSSCPHRVVKSCSASFSLINSVARARLSYATETHASAVIQIRDSKSSFSRRRFMQQSPQYAQPRASPRFDYEGSPTSHSGSPCAPYRWLSALKAHVFHSELEYLGALLAVSSAPG